ncbi:MAG: DciA family protein [bacterium]|nr:DciA family protein [bacterium]
MAFHTIKSLLNKSVQRAGIGRQIDATHLVEFFNEKAPALIGAELAQDVEAKYVSNNILAIECKSSLVMQELKYRENDIIAELNKYVSGQKISKLKYLS